MKPIEQNCLASIGCGQLTTRAAQAGDDEAHVPARRLVPMDRGEPAAGMPVAGDGSMPALAKLRIAAGIAATIGLVAGEVFSELRQRRLLRTGRRG